MRLDQYLVDEGLAPSRNIAQQLIKEGKIKVSRQVVTKPSFKVEAGSVVEKDIEHIYVGRAAYKLKAFLASHPVGVEGKEALDIGSSTGGFTEILLERGVASVVALDIGKDQLHERIRRDSRVMSVEEQDVRTYEHTPFELVTCDVSFISLHHILESIDRLAAKDIIILFKPQFEVGVGVKRNRAGVVQDEKAIDKAKERFKDACTLLGWQLQVEEASKLEGKEGNREYFYYFSKHN